MLGISNQFDESDKFGLIHDCLTYSENKYINNRYKATILRKTNFLTTFHLCFFKFYIFIK